MSVSLVASPNAFLQATAQPLWSSTYLARSERKWRGLSLNEATDPCRSTIPAHPRNRHPTYPSSHHCHPKVRPPPGRRRSMFSRSSVRPRADVRPILRALQTNAPLLQGPHLPPAAPPAFLLDANRRTGRLAGR